MKRNVLGCIFAAGCVSQNSAYQPERVYDFENHMYLPEFLDYLKTRTTYPYSDAAGILHYTESGLMIYRSDIPGNNNPESNLLKDITDVGDFRLSEMDYAGISTAILSHSQGIEQIPKEEAVKFAKLTNDAVAEAVQKYPGRFLGTITLPAPYVEESIAELERCVNELGLQYWHTHSNYGDEHLYDEKFEPLLAKCAELDVPVYLHPDYPQTPYLTDSGAAAAGPGFGFGVDTMKTSLNLIIRGTFDRYPDLQLILGHMGEFYPYVLDRMDNRFSILKPGDTVAVNKEGFEYYFKNKNIFITTSGIYDENTVICAINTIGIDSILFATDYPYEDAKAEVEFIRSLPISSEDKDKIFYKNAEKYVLKDRS